MLRLTFRLAQDASAVYHLLDAISKLPRFDLAAQFMSSSELAHARTLFSSLIKHTTEASNSQDTSVTKPISPDSLADLQKRYFV